MAYVLNIQLVVLLTGLLLTLLIIVPVHCVKLWYWWQYSCCIYPHRVYWAVVAMWWVVCVLSRIKVAYAVGETDVIVSCFRAYPCAGISIKKLALHELHQHGTHIAGFHASGLPQLGYYYLPLPKTGELYEGDALIYNPGTNHALTIQYKTALNKVPGVDKLTFLLQDYGANTQLLSYGVYEPTLFEQLVKQVFPLLSSKYEQNKISLDCISYVMNPYMITNNNEALVYDQALVNQKTQVNNTVYNQMVACYFSQIPDASNVEWSRFDTHLQNAENEFYLQKLTDAQVISYLTSGIASFLGVDNVARMSEM